MTDLLPSAKGDNGRDPTTGRFVPGYKGGPGNPHSRRVADIRRTVVEEVSDDDLRQLVRTLVNKGKAGDVMAAREVLDRLVGKPKATIAIEESESEAEAFSRVVVEVHGVSDERRAQLTDGADEGHEQEGG